MSGMSASPGGPADDAAEVAAVEMRLLVRKDVGLDVAEGRIGLVLDAVVEGLDDVFFEMLRAGMALHDRLALDVAVFGIGQPQHVHLTPAVTSATTGCMCCGIPGVVWRAIAVQTVAISASEMPCPHRKSRAAFAPSTSKRSLGLLYRGVSPMSWNMAPA